MAQEAVYVSHGTLEVDVGKCRLSRCGFYTPNESTRDDAVAIHSRGLLTRLSDPMNAHLQLALVVNTRQNVADTSGTLDFVFRRKRFLLFVSSFEACSRVGKN